jgi:hypothetical protein
MSGETARIILCRAKMWPAGVLAGFVPGGLIPFGLEADSRYVMADVPPTHDLDVQCGKVVRGRHKAGHDTGGFFRDHTILVLYQNNMLRRKAIATDRVGHSIGRRVRHQNSPATDFILTSYQTGISRR